MYVEYIGVVTLLTFGLVIGLVILLLTYFIAFQSSYAEKVSAYECGFNPFEDARNKFDVQFYLVSILFIIFDLEISFFFPWVAGLSFSGYIGFFSMFCFVVVLTVGLVYEWKRGALDWKQ